MKVRAYITVGDKVEELTGNTNAFGRDGSGGPLEVRPEIGFWLFDWKRHGDGGPTNPHPVFVPWWNCAYIVRMDG